MLKLTMRAIRNHDLRERAKLLHGDRANIVAAV